MKRRQRQRGAAMVESLMIVPLLIIIDVALVYMQSAYDTRLSTMRGARAEAWSYAMGACESGGPTSSSDGTDGSLGPLGGVLAPAKRLAVGRSLTAPLETNLGVGAATSVKSSRAGAGVEAFGSRTMTTHSRVLCNEKPNHVSESDTRATIHALYSKLIP